MLPALSHPMPVYETATRGHSRYAHLARRYDEATPPCPECGSAQPEKLSAAAHLGRSEAARRATWVGALEGRFNLPLELKKEAETLAKQ